MATKKISLNARDVKTGEPHVIEFDPKTGAYQMKHPGGRPPAVGTARGERVIVRMTPDEKAAASELAAAEGLSVSDWIRKQLKNAWERRVRRESGSVAVGARRVARRD
jgi:hypothetical protein